MKPPKMRDPAYTRARRCQAFHLSGRARWCRRRPMIRALSLFWCLTAAGRRRLCRQGARRCAPPPPGQPPFRPRRRAASPANISTWRPPACRRRSARPPLCARTAPPRCGAMTARPAAPFSSCMARRWRCAMSRPCRTARRAPPTWPVSPPCESSPAKTSVAGFRGPSAFPAAVPWSCP